MELIRAITLTWLFSGQRSDEIARLRVGCIRWQHDGLPIAGDSREVLAARRGLPARRARPQDRHRVHQAGRPDPRPGHRGVAGRAPRPAEDDSTARPASTSTCCSPSAPSRSPRPTSTTRSSRRSAARPASPTADVRGNITSHRARSTIASQLYNAKEPMTLFELQAWLGHRIPADHPALREDHPEHADQGLHRRRLLRPQRPHHRGPHRPRRRHLRRRRCRRALAALRPRPRLLHLHLLRAVPAPNGLRPLRLLHPEGLQQGPAARSQGQPAADARHHPAHRRRTRRRRRRTRRPRPRCSTGSPTSPPPPGRRPVNSTFQPPPPSCRSSRSAKPGQR